MNKNRYYCECGETHDMVLSSKAWGFLNNKRGDNFLTQYIRLKTCPANKGTKIIAEYEDCVLVEEQLP